MGKSSKVVVCGMKGVGKTTILEQVIYGTLNEQTEVYPTIEDIYIANIETDRGTKEKVRFYDTAGIELSQTSTAHGTTNQQLPRHYIAIADGYLLVYDSERSESLEVLAALKKDIDKNKDKKEVVIVVLGNRTKDDKEGSDVSKATINKAKNWCSKERLSHFVLSSMVRQSMFEAFVHLTSRLNPPPSKSSFSQLSMGRKATPKE